MSNCKVIALTNQKGGVGKTTTAVNLGVSLAQQGKKVLLIDADAQANLTMSLGYHRPDDLPVTLSTIMQDIIEDNPIDVQKSILHHGEGVDLLPSNIELSGLEVRLINAISRESVLKTCVNEVKKNYDYCLIDCMPSLGMLTINALAAADSVVIPTQPHYLSAKGLELLLRSVSKVRRQINPPLRIDGILLHNRRDMAAFARANPEAAFMGNYCTEYGFRVDTEKHAFLLRCNPTKGDYNFYCYCYVKDWLDGHIQKAEQGIRFIDPHYNEKFRIPDGGKITIHYAWGEKAEKTCRFIDECHTEVGSNLYHICEFAERMEQNGHSYEPKPEEPPSPKKAPKHRDHER